MEVKQFWFNLPAKNVAKATEFYRALRFRESEMHPSNDHMARFFIGEQKVGMMLFPEATFEEYTGHKVTDTNLSSEVLLNIDAQNREEVQEYAEEAKKAGGIVYLEPQLLQGWMYTCGFSDLDGHRWNVLYMDMDNMPERN